MTDDKAKEAAKIYVLDQDCEFSGCPYGEHWSAGDAERSYLAGYEAGARAERERIASRIHVLSGGPRADLLEEILNPQAKEVPNEKA
jgi:hypothetical protein